jgi:hypothetical protein
MTKERCECGKLAIWVYMPGYSNGDHPFFCDDCVPRGCECNHRFIGDEELPNGEEGKNWIRVDNNNWVFLDEKQREFPCSEFDNDPDGYERELNPHLLN